MKLNVLMIGFDSISRNLFKKIFANRTCSQAGVETYWCSCLNWKPVNLTGKKVVNASE